METKYKSILIDKFVVETVTELSEQFLKSCNGKIVKSKQYSFDSQYRKTVCDYLKDQNIKFIEIPSSDFHSNGNTGNPNLSPSRFDNFPLPIGFNIKGK